MNGLIKNKMKIVALEKRLMLDASLGALISSTVLAEDSVNATPEVIDGDVSISGATTDFTGEDLTISTTGGAEDQLTIIDEGLGAGQIGFDGANIRYEGTIIGTLSSNGVNGADLTISLNVNASQAGIERLIENVTYQNISDAPTAGRTVNIALGAFFSEDVTITVVAQNDDPVATTNTGISVVEGASVTITDTQLNVTDTDDADSDIVFNITSAVTDGQIELSTNVGVAITSFTRDDLVNNRVVYVHDDTNTVFDSFDFTVTDGDTTLAEDTFDITITPINDPLSLDTNAGTTVFQNFSTTIGNPDPVQFGTELVRNSGVGNYSSWDGTIDNKNIQFSVVFTTPGAAPTGVPGEVIFESGGAGVGVGLVLNSAFELEFYAGPSAPTPELTGDSLLANTQYAVVIEIDQVTDEIRMHFEEAGDFNWYAFGVPPKEVLTGYTLTDHSGSGAAGVGQMNPDIGGYNGTRSGQTSFQGTIHSDVVVTEFPETVTTNTMLVANDPDTNNNNLVYTITTDVYNGTLYNNGVALGLGDTFTQSDLNLGLVTYTNMGGVAESFDFSVTDGDTVIAGQTFTITIDTSNVAPEILTTTTILDEDFEGGTAGWNNNSTTTHSTLSEFWGQFNRNIHVGGDQELYQTFATSGTQDYIVVEFDFYELDSWDNEYWYVFVNDTNILGNSHRLRWNVLDSPSDGTNGNVSYSVQETTEALGEIAYNGSYYDQIYHYTLVIEGSDPTMKLGFGSTLNGTGLTDESFGIDNLKITEVKKAGADAQEFYLSEFASNGDTVGTLQAVDENVGQPITYSITGGTGNGLFSIDANTGAITVTDNSTFDYEATTSYTLDVRVTDSLLSDTDTITINMLDVMENTRPTVNGATFSIAEDAANNDDVGTMTSTDPEGDTVTYSIVGGTGQGIFKIDANTGLIEVLDNTVLDYDIQSSYSLTIRGTDDNDLSLYHNRGITINLTDVDEAPSLDVETVIETLNPGIIYSVDTGNFYYNDSTNRNVANQMIFAHSQFLNGVEGHMATITSAAEFNFIRDYASVSHVWMPLSDAAEEGKWIWIDGPEAGNQISQGNVDAIGWYNNWTGSEPNGGVTRNTGMMHSNGLWYDNWPDTNAYGVTVEWEGEDIINNSYYRVNHSNADASDVSNGDSVGFVQGVDPEGDSLDFSIQAGNADGIFEIDTATGEVRILDNTNLDASVQDTYVLTIRATENAGVKFDEIDITIKFNDDFSISANNPISVAEAGTTTITTADLNIADPDDVATDIKFHVTTLPANGQLESSVNPGYQIASFTLDDIQNGRISFVHDGTETTTDSFVFEVTDGGRDLTAQTFNINIAPVNDAPTIVTNTGAPVTEGSNVTITSAMLDSADIDDVDTGLTYTASSLVNGHIEVNGVTQTTFTQDDIDNNRVVFVHDGGEGATSFDFSLADGGEDLAAPATGTFTFTVTAVNDTPLITTNTGASVVEGANVTVTTAMLNVTDPDDSGTGLVYTLSNINNGQVELSTSPGNPIISFTQADLVANRVVFVHDGGENDARFDVSVVDGGEDGAVADAATFNLTRIPVNDSPTIGTNAGSSVNQNSIVLLKRAVLAAADPDDSGVGLTFTITGAANGQLEYLSNPNVAITSFTQDDIDNSRVVFRHSGATTGTYFDFSIADGGEDTSVPATGRFNLTVDNVNDAPIISTNTGPTVAEGSTTVLTSAMLDSFDPDDFGTGLEWTASNLVNGIIQVSGVTQNTFTQADLDAGIVTFVHDGSETNTAGFDISLADGGENGAPADTDTFTMGVTAVNDAPTLVVNDGTPNIIDFNDYTIDTFDPSQDGVTPGVVSGDGSMLTIGPNSWKKIDLPYTLTANTVLSLEFRAETVTEILGIGFDDDNSIGDGVFGYQLGGTQVWSGTDQTFRNYQPGDGWVRYDIPIGADFTGVMDRMVFILDDDASPTGTAMFRNVNFYEANQIVAVDEGGTFNITTAHITGVDPDDSGTGLDYTVSNVANGVVQVSGVTVTTFTQDDLDNNRVTFVHDGSDTLNAGFDISLADGGEDSAAADTGNFTLIVNPVNDAPVVSVNTGGAMDEGASLTITSAMLNEADPDDEGGKLTYTVSALTNGVIQVSGVTKTTFTQYDIDQGRVKFVHNDSQTTAASFNFSLADGLEDGAVADTGTFNIVVTPVNDNVVLATNTGANITESGTVTITSARLNATDVDDTAAATVFTITDIENGWVELTTKVGFPVMSFTQDDINNNRVVFRHDGSGSGAAEFDFSVDDGGEDGTVAVTGTFAVTVTPAVNEAPVIAITDGAPTTVDFGSATISPYDPSGAGDGQSSTATSYEVSTDGSVLTIYGNAWKKIPFATTLTADTVLTFDFRSTKEGEIHGIGFETDDVIGNGSYSYELFGTDANGLFDQSYNTYNLGDGWTRFEIPIGADFTGAVTDLFFMADDDAGADAISQFRNVSVYKTNPTVTVLEGGSVGITNTNLNMFDTDDAAANVTYTASALTNGIIKVNGVTQNTFTQADVNNGLVFFIHDDSQTTSASFNLSLADGLENFAVADTATFNITVTPENDAPTIDTNLGATVAEGGSIVMSNTRLASSDVDNTDAGLTYTITALPGGTFENTNTASVLGVNDSFTQGDINSGFIRYTHDGGESTSERVSVTLSDGTATLTAVDFTWNITRVNDAPDNVGLTDNVIDEDASIGTWIGDLYSEDVDLPGDTFTYSIMSDPDNKFAIVGNQLFVNGALDFETSAFHNVTIRTNDNNGGTFDRVMTITVLDINETPFIAPSTGRGPGGDFNGIVIEDDFRRGPANGALIEAAFSEGGVEGAFYGEDGIGQILRERTTVEIREMTNDNEIGDNVDPVKDVVAAPSGEPTLEEIESAGDYTNLRQMLEALQNFAEDDGDVEGEESGAEEGGEASIKDEKFHNLYDQFEDVLTYHEQKKEKLRQALLSE